MKCPYCSQENTRVIDSRPAEDNSSIRRRRLCDSCGKRFTTYEKIETIPIIVIKKDNNREPYDRSKIEDGILLWLESGDCSYCLFVDELAGEQQVVVKPLPAYLNSFNMKNAGIAGCTILGNGSISIILDIPNLYQMAQTY